MKFTVSSFTFCVANGAPEMAPPEPPSWPNFSHAKKPLTARAMRSNAATMNVERRERGAPGASGAEAAGGAAVEVRGSTLGLAATRAGSGVLTLKVSDAATAERARAVPKCRLRQK